MGQQDKNTQSSKGTQGDMGKHAGGPHGNWGDQGPQTSGGGQGSFGGGSAGDQTGGQQAGMQGSGSQGGSMHGSSTGTGASMTDEDDDTSRKSKDTAGGF